MKKFYALFALATAMTASAAVPANSVNFEQASASFNMNSINVEATVNSGDMLKAPAVGDVNNYRALSYYGMTDSDNDQQIGGVELRKISDTEVQIFGLGIFGSDYPITATYDASAQTLTIKKQVWMSAAEMNEMTGGQINEPIYAWPVATSDNGMISVNQIVLTYCPEGVTMGENEGVFKGGFVLLGGTRDGFLMFNTQANFDAQSGGSMSGWLGSWKYLIALPPLEEFFPLAPGFTYDASEWNSIGDADFSDGWGILDGSAAYKVPCYQNKRDSNLYMLLNPYGANTPYVEYNGTANMEGYIVFDVTNPEVVTVWPHVNSGLTLPDYGMMAGMACTNREGIAFYLQEYTLEEIYEEAIMYDDELSTCKDGVVTLPNCVFQNVPQFDVEDLNYWVDNNRNPVPMVSTIKLPNGGGIQGLTNDAEAAPRYFNLQGMEINTPANGEIVIVKEGSKTSKTIVR